ncbi:MAG: GvpL/GvpF family gas vesicle protein [Elainella sp. Prado103]|jgi:hypothetical protein|nr:GvpL/GvpF family gas vesicle protein [Elainella sp. Prado103]
MYTYAFLLNETPLELPEGIWGSLELVGVDRLAALIEPELQLESVQQSDRQLMQALLSHDRVIQEVFQQTTVLPLRFGTCFVSRARLLEHLQTHQLEYLEKLDYLQGKAEYVLKFSPLPYVEPTLESGLAGKAYFLAKKQLYQKQAAWQQQQQAELQSLHSLVEEHYPEAIRGGSAEDGIERVYLLLTGKTAIQLQAHLQVWQPQFSTWELSLSNTLPPYHFV